MTAGGQAAVEPALSRPVSVDGLGEAGRRLRVVAEAGERERLAERLELLRLDRLEADILLTPAGNRRSFRLSASLEAEVVQSCGVTLEPVASTIRATVERLYSADAVGESEGLAAAGEVEVGHDEVEPAEPLIDHTIDVGHAVAEQLALEIDPFPRAAGVEFEGYTSGPEEEASPHPFASLAKLKEGGSGENR